MTATAAARAIGLRQSYCFQPTYAASIVKIPATRLVLFCSPTNRALALLFLLCFPCSVVTMPTAFPFGGTWGDASA